MGAGKVRDGTWAWGMGWLGVGLGPACSGAAWRCFLTSTGSKLTGTAASKSGLNMAASIQVSWCQLLPAVQNASGMNADSVLQADILSTGHLQSDLQTSKPAEAITWRAVEH